MKKRLLFSFLGIIVSIISINYLINSNTGDKNLASNEINELREQHQKYLANSPFKRTLKLSKKERKAEGIPPNKYFEREWELTMDPSTGKPHPERLFDLQESLRKNNLANKNPGSAAWNNWEERGPNDVGGRTRAIMYDPNDVGVDDKDYSRVFAGGVGGGLWVNNDITDENSSWLEVNIPQNLAISVITYDPNNKSVFYVGTGESYVGGKVNGNGLWKSIDGGVNWSNIFEGIIGETTFQSDIKLTVNSPSLIAGDYQATSAAFGPSITSISGNLVLADDSSVFPTEACNVLTNNIAIDGNIAVVERGNCTFVSKVKNAQDAGAKAVLVINNVSGVPISLGGEEDGTITIPSLMISKEDGALIMQQLGTGVNVTIGQSGSPFPEYFVTPGIKHINDVKVRDIGGGKSEVYVAVGQSFYAGSTPSSLLGVEQFGLYKSTDEEAVWSKVNLPLITGGSSYSPNDIEISSDGTIWISTNNNIYGKGGGTILSSSDGATFNVKHTITDGKRTQIAVSKLNAGVVYVLAELNSDITPVYIAKTADSFINVDLVSLPEDGDEDISADDFTRGQAFYNLMLEVDPTDDNKVYVGGIDLFRSQDGGTNWSQISKWSNNPGLGSLSIPLVHADHHILVFNPVNSDQGLFGTDGGIYFASSLSEARTKTSAILSRNKDYNTLQFYKGAIGSERTSEKLVAGAQDNGTQFINNATSGINSSIRISGGDGAYTFIDKDNEYMITSYVYNNYYYFNYATGNFVYDITENSDDGDFINPAALDSDHNILYASGANYTAGTDTWEYKIYKYTLGTASATRVTFKNSLLTSSPTAFKTSTFTTSTLFVGTERGALLKLENANTANPTWSDITGTNFYGSISCIEQGTTEDEIMITFHNYGVKNVYYTKDGGTTWLNKEGDLPDLPVKAILMNPINPDEVILGTDLGVWGTSNFNDANPTWVQSQNGMKDVPVTSFDLRTSDHTVLASTYGRGLFTAKFTVDDYYDDDDNDTVINGLDLCTSTPAGEPVDADGCSDSQLDDDKDGVMNNTDLCDNTTSGAMVDDNGCFTLASDNFAVQVISEKCIAKDNGQIIITTTEPNYTYRATINSVNYTFTATNDLVSEDLPVGLYDFFITVEGENYEQHFSIEIEPGTSAKGSAKVSSNKAIIEIEEGTAPFAVYVNDKESFITSETKFSVAVKNGDIIDVKTSVACEGVYSKTIELLDEIVAYPNPTNGTFEISLPVTQKEVTIELYTIHSQLISVKKYPIVYGKVQLNIENQPTGLYLAKIKLDKPVTLKIIKQ